MSRNRGLSRRLSRDLLIAALYISIAAVAGVIAVVWVFDDGLTKRALSSEADFFWERQLDGPPLALPETRNMVAYLRSSGTPDELEPLLPGFHRLDGPKRSVVFVSDRGDERLYLVFDSARVNELVALFGLVPLVVVLIVIAIAMYSAYRVSRRAVSPVISLAANVARLDPSSPQPSLFRVPEEADDEIQQLATALEGLSERLDSFAERERNFTRDASHELRSPLTVIRMAAQRLADDASLDRAGQASVERIAQAAKDMEELTQAFLLLARDSERALDADWVCVNDVVEGEVERSRYLMEGRKVRLSVHAEQRLLTCGPEKVLASMIGNLVRNGLAYTDEGEVRVTIDDSRIVISDTGPGMTAGVVSQVFEPFYRGGRTARRRGGHGVGLTIVKRLSERFGWPLDVDSQPGRGTSVTVSFPNSKIETLPSPDHHAAFTAAAAH
ncbi:MAG: HAMP domain-containing sensor histidine kinase [Pseudomonadota bacterium]